MIAKNPLPTSKYAAQTGRIGAGEPRNLGWQARTKLLSAFQPYREPPRKSTHVPHCRSTSPINHKRCPVPTQHVRSSQPLHIPPRLRRPLSHLPRQPRRLWLPSPPQQERRHSDWAVVRLRHRHQRATDWRTRHPFLCGRDTELCGLQCDSDHLERKGSTRADVPGGGSDALAYAGPDVAVDTDLFDGGCVAHTGCDPGLPCRYGRAFTVRRLHCRYTRRECARGSRPRRIGGRLSFSHAQAVGLQSRVRRHAPRDHHPITQLGRLGSSRVRAGVWGTAPLARAVERTPCWTGRDAFWDGTF